MIYESLAIIADQLNQYIAANDAKDEVVTTLEASENDLKESNARLVDSEATLQASESELKESNDQLIESEATLQASESDLLNKQRHKIVSENASNLKFSSPELHYNFIIIKEFDLNKMKSTITLEKI